MDQKSESSGSRDGPWSIARRSAVGWLRPRRSPRCALVGLVAAAATVALVWGLVAGPVGDRNLAARALPPVAAGSLGLLVGGLVGAGLASLRSRRAQARQSTLCSAAQVALALDHADLGILFADRSGVVRFASGGAEQLFARSREALVGRSFRSLCTDDSGLSDDSLHGGRQPGVARTFELDGLRPDGTSFPLELVVRQVELEGEALALMLVRDVSQRRRNDLELQRKNEFISTILENLPLALTVNAIDDGEILYVNPVFEHVYGWPRDGFENVDDGFLALFPDPQEREAARRRIVAGVLGAASRPCKWDNVEITTAAGERRYVTAVGIPLFGQNLVIAAAQDVTEARRARIHLAERERLAAVGELAAGIAHDFNNLLQVVVMHCELAMAASRGSAEVARHLETVLAQSIRGADLIRQILDFARETPLELQPVALEPIVREALDAVAPTLPSGVVVECAVAGGGLCAAADATRVQQLVNNLVINAADAMPGGGRVTVRLQPFELAPGAEPPVSQMEPGRWVRLEVADEGVGMSAEVASRVFEPFFTTKPRTRGTGLGLALVYGIVAQHHGHVGVTTAPGRGAVFSVFLPLVPPAGAAGDRAATAPERTPRGAGETVLVVEDDEAIREVARHGLESLGYRALTVGDGAAAFAILEQRGDSVDVVLSDLVMPGIDGTRLAREVRARWPCVRVVLMTGFAPDHDSGERLAAGIAACLHKPFTMSELARTLAHVLAAPVPPMPTDG